jgi:hypothetical protein
MAAVACPGLAAEPAPAVSELVVEPAALVLTGPRDARRYVVRGKTADGSWVDLTRAATPQLTGDAVRLVEGYLEPVKDGAATLTLRHGDRAVPLPISVTGQGKAEPVSFVRDIMPILGKTGCNAGTCHGAAKGRNGFKLSLRGYDPDFDHEQIVDELAGRRVDRKEPANSLVLLKPTQGVPHEGRFLFPENSRYYRLIHQWVAEGCRLDTADTQRVQRLEVLPLNPILNDIGQKQQLVVIAHYPDGTSRDVTRDAVYTSSQEPIAIVSGDGLVEAVRKGETAILIRQPARLQLHRRAGRPEVTADQGHPLGAVLRYRLPPPGLS